MRPNNPDPDRPDPLAAARAVIDKALALMANGPCTGAWARNAQGQTTGANNPDAVVFCATGAIRRARQTLIGDDEWLYNRVCDALENAGYDSSRLMRLNDRRPALAKDELTRIRNRLA